MCHGDRASIMLPIVIRRPIQSQLVLRFQMHMVAPRPVSFSAIGACISHQIAHACPTKTIKEDVHSFWSSLFSNY